ncbi:hypothetical protein B0H13DRAFT_2310293 [Mycena leptocephala]|nr:hypothetical protein B0H13DRAFT_2310293 [Mycena leptocephala]
MSLTIALFPTPRILPLNHFSLQLTFSSFPLVNRRGSYKLQSHPFSSLASHRERGSQSADATLSHSPPVYRRALVHGIAARDTTTPRMTWTRQSCVLPIGPAASIVQLAPEVHCDAPPPTTLFLNARYPTPPPLPLLSPISYRNGCVGRIRYTAPPPASLSHHARGVVESPFCSICLPKAQISAVSRTRLHITPSADSFASYPRAATSTGLWRELEPRPRVHLSVWGGGHPYERIDIPLLWLHILRHTCSLLLEGGAIVSLDARHTGSAWARDAWRIRTVPAQRCAPPVTRGETREERVKMDARMVRAFGVTPTPAASTAVWMRTVPSRPPALPSRCPALSLARTLPCPAAGNSSLDIFGRSRRLRKTYAGVGSAPSLTRAGQPVVSSRLPLSPVFSAEDQD